MNCASARMSAPAPPYVGLARRPQYPACARSATSSGAMMPSGRHTAFRPACGAGRLPGCGPSRHVRNLEHPDLRCRTPRPLRASRSPGEQDCFRPSSALPSGPPRVTMPTLSSCSACYIKLPRWLRRSCTGSGSRPCSMDDRSCGTASGVESHRAARTFFSCQTRLSLLFGAVIDASQERQSSRSSCRRRTHRCHLGSCRNWRR